MTHTAETDIDDAATRHKAAHTLEPGDPRATRDPESNVLECNHDVLQTVMRFAGDSYLFVASVSTRWRHAWGQRPAVTSRRRAVQSCACLDWAKGCGLDIWDDPCLNAAAEGRLDVLQHAAALGYSRECMPICEWAAGAGHLEVVKWCRANGYPWGRSNLRAAEGGQLEVLRWCVANGCPLLASRSLLAPIGSDTFSVILAAAKGGQVEVVRWCREQGVEWPSEACYQTAKGGHFELLRWMRANGCPWSSNTMDGAVEAGHLEMLVWCDANGCPRPSSICTTAARHSNLEIVEWCVNNSPDGNWDSIPCLPAAAQGHLEVVQRLRAKGCPWGRGVCFSAASSGHFEVLKWCVENGCPWDRIPRNPIVAFKGSLAMMLWATANGCPWMRSKVDSARLCEHAAAGGNLEIVQWCRTFEGLDTYTFEALDMFRMSQAAASKGHVHILEWLRPSSSLSDASIVERLWSSAVFSGSLEVLKWCRANGFPWDEGTFDAAATQGNLKLLQWCRDNGCPWDERISMRAAERGDLEMLAWCLTNGCPWVPVMHYYTRLEGNEEMAEWCKSRGYVVAKAGG